MSHWFQVKHTGLCDSDYINNTYSVQCAITPFQNTTVKTKRACHLQVYCSQITEITRLLITECWGSAIDQFRYITIQSQTIDLRTRLWGLNPTNSVFIPQSLVLRSIVRGWILIYRNWSIKLTRQIQTLSFPLW